MRTKPSLEIPELNRAIIRAANDDLLGILDQFGDMGGVLSGQISDEVACCDVPNLDCFIQTGAEKGNVVLE